MVASRDHGLPALRSGSTRALRIRAAMAERLQGRCARTVTLVLAAFALLLAWNVAHYPAGNSMDARAHFRYADSIQRQHRLPTMAETQEAQTPPLFYVAAAAIQSTWESVTGAPGGEKVTHKVVQMVNALMAVCVALLVFLIGRELFPASRIPQITALAFFVLMPSVTRTAVMYHGQTLAMLLSTAALYVLVRALVRGELGVKHGAIAGVLLGLGVLTRVFVLATAGATVLALFADFAFTRRRESLRAGGVLVLAVASVSSPWFIHQQVTYGSPLAQSLDAWRSRVDARNKPFFERQPPEFYLGRPFKTVFTMPYRPAFANRLPQVVYTDWWGDYFLYYDVPSTLRPANAAARLPGGRLPAPYDQERVRQSYAGLLPTVLMLIGLLGLVGEGVRRRSAALLVLPATAALVGLAAMAWIIGYPTTDGDTMKAFYLITAVPSLAIGAGFALWRLHQRSRTAFALVVAVLLVAAVVDVQFLWIDHAIGRLERG